MPFFIDVNPQIRRFKPLGWVVSNVRPRGQARAKRACARRGWGWAVGAGCMGRKAERNEAGEGRNHRTGKPLQG